MSGILEHSLSVTYILIKGSAVMPSSVVMKCIRAQHCQLGPSKD